MACADAAATQGDVAKEMPSLNTLIKVSGHFSNRNDCVRLAAALRLNDAYQERMQRTEVSDFQILALDVLERWTGEKTDRATGEALCQALRDINRNDVADNLQTDLIGV